MIFTINNYLYTIHQRSRHFQTQINPLSEADAENKHRCKYFTCRSMVNRMSYWDFSLNGTVASSQFHYDWSACSSRVCHASFTSNRKLEEIVHFLIRKDFLTPAANKRNACNLQQQNNGQAFKIQDQISQIIDLTI